MRTQLIAGVLLAVTSAAAQYGTPDRPLDVPFVPSPNVVVDAMLKLADVKKTDTVYDLGCGDGRIVITAAKTYGAHGVGVDLNPERVQEAQANAKSAGVESLVKFEENDLFKADISKATVVTLYLLPDVNNRLKPKLLSDLKPGTRVVSHSFEMNDWKPEKEATVDGRHIYLWIIPKK
jgi:SAM-dependent methyltransferase